MPNYHHYFVKKLLSMAMDRRDKEKEMAAFLLSSLYAQIIDPQQVYQGFCNLLESADDLVMDIPDFVEVLAIFIARAVVDDILPPAFLSKQMESLQEDSKGKEILIRAKKGYLSTPYHGEILERKWGTSKSKSVENVRERISNLLREYVVSGDKKEASRCIKDLHVPFFHHEIVKQAILMAMEKRKAEGRVLDLLKMCEEEGLINSSQMTKGFSRLIDNIDDLCLDIPNAREILQSLITKAASGGWLHASSLKSLTKRDIDVKLMKSKVESIIQEYFLSGDVLEVCNSLESLNGASSELNGVFVKRLINLAMDRRKREKEMASMLLSSLCLPADDVVIGFMMLIEFADDIALDNPIVVDDLAMFLARTVVDEVVAPSHLDEIENYCFGSNAIISTAKSLLNAHLAAERILRCWGGGGNGIIGWRIEDVKDKIKKLLEEYEGGGGFKEAYRCIKELSMPFFYHEIVKRVLVMEIEKRNERLWGFLDECFKSGLITMNQMTKGFGRVVESMDDLVLDVPDAKIKFVDYVDKAMAQGWLDPSFSLLNSGHVLQNGF
nr:MA3 domain-containing translation regulatory factor 2 [Fagopyrum tataricum]